VEDPERLRALRASLSAVIAAPTGVEAAK